MSFFDLIFNLIIEPLNLIFEFIFSISNKFLDNPGLSIIILSLIMNFLVLPLYKRADAIQNDQRMKEEKVKPLADHIKKYFKGDERFMLLQTHYRQNNYSPIGVLKSSVSLLLQIPFFIAAYQMLSNLEVLDGVPFGLINDLNSPDGLITIGSHAINVLPIVMTLINIISGAIYTKGMSANNKVQLYGMAGVFLILLYNSPSGLVFYWTLNNVFSLLKNIFYKIKNSKIILYSLSCVIGFVLLILSIVRPVQAENMIDANIIVYSFIILLEFPVLKWIFKKINKFDIFKKIETPHVSKITFLIGCFALAIITGIFIPSNMMKSSPEEFIDINVLVNPSYYLINSFTVAVGFFVFWFGVFYMLASEKGKRFQEAMLLISVGTSLVNYFNSTDNDIVLDSKLVFNQNIEYVPYTYLIGFMVFVLAAAVLFLIWRVINKSLKPLYTILVISLIVISSMNFYTINKVSSAKIENIKVSGNQLATIPLSKNGKNVIVLMMDRAISSYVPYIMNEKPELSNKFDGFTYYPNTISYGGSTNYGVPGVYGGYEYIPKAMNNRPNESLESKHNEALKVMPVLFDNNNFDVTVCDPSYAGYDWIPDLSIYNEYENIRAFNTFGKFNQREESNPNNKNNILMRNLFCFSIFEVSPYFMKTIIYDYGAYNQPGILAIQKKGEGVTAKGLSDDFMDAYSVLKNLPNITEIGDENNNTFLMMSNDTTHNPMFLQEPNYEPSFIVDNNKFYNNLEQRFVLNDNSTLKFEWSSHVKHYEANMAAMLQLGRWFDYLRENGVYDNTKIIIVSDHGYPLFQRKDMELSEDVDLMQYNALLMVKDFNSKGFDIDTTFMTNADTPAIATKGVIENPVNPFTNNPIQSEQKNSDLNYIYRGGDWNIIRNNGNTFSPEQWLTVKDNVFDKKQWEIVN